MKREIVLLCILFVAPLAQAKLQVVTTTTDLKFLVDSVGKEKVEVRAIAKGTQDPHSIEAKPSFMVKLRDADLIVAQGLELEAAWLVPLVRGARNPQIAIGSKGYLELGSYLEPLEVTQAPVSRAAGDVHPDGNPHFQLDPVRMAQAAMIIASRLAELDIQQKEFFRANAEELQKQLQKKTADWQSRLRKTQIREVVTYHKTFSYFLNRFGIEGNLQLEPKPGIPPAASHLMAVIQKIKEKKIKLVLIENLFDDSAAAKLRQSVPNINVSRVPVSVGGEPDVQSTEQLIEKIVRAFEEAAR